MLEPCIKLLLHLLLLQKSTGLTPISVLPSSTHLQHEHNSWKIPFTCKRRSLLASSPPPLLPSNAILTKITQRSRPYIPLLLSTEGTNEADASISVGDYVKELHGGKYQFDDLAAAPGMSSAGRQFAESLYSSSSCEDDSVQEDDEPFPRWVERMKPPLLNDDENYPTMEVGVNGEPVHVVITNQERTWEKFHAMAMMREEGVPTANHAADDAKGDAPGPFVVEPRTGFLAPRGGASNACDPRKPYSDSADIVVRCHSGVGVDGDWWLIMGTEEEKWYYRLKVKG